VGVIRETLFGKVDLDTLTTAFVLGLNPARVLFRNVKGSASSEALADKSVMAIEVGGSGRTAENNFDHHSSPSETGTTVNLSACAQALERLAKLVRYVDELDRGVLSERAQGFPSLAQLTSGMLLCVKNPEQRMSAGLELLAAVVQSGVDPYGSMESLLDDVAGAREWAKAKREHEAKADDVLEEANWLTTKNGLRIAYVETDWIGAPGALYGRGAQIVVALNPAMDSGGQKIRKFTVAGHKANIIPALEKLNELEDGWGGPSHGTIGGSPQDRDSELELETVVDIVCEML
jgi:hypothetical protein